MHILLKITLFCIVDPVSRVTKRFLHRFEIAEFLDRQSDMGTRAACRSEAIVRSRKLLDIRYLAHSSSENIFRSG